MLQAVVFVSLFGLCEMQPRDRRKSPRVTWKPVIRVFILSDVNFGGDKHNVICKTPI